MLSIIQSLVLIIMMLTGITTAFSATTCPSPPNPPSFNNCTYGGCVAGPSPIFTGNAYLYNCSSQSGSLASVNITYAMSQLQNQLYVMDSSNNAYIFGCMQPYVWAQSNLTACKVGATCYCLLPPSSKKKLSH